MPKIIVSLFILLLSLQVVARTEVKVRGYSFSPFLDFKDDGTPYGATINLINALNGVQTKYLFKFYKTSSKRRYNHFENKELDIIFFEDKAWGWDKYKIDATKIFAKGGEVFIAKKAKGRSQEYFNDLNNKRIIGVLGFHYAFANFEANENILKRKFNMLLTSSPEYILDLIMKNRGEVGVITESLLRKKLNTHKKLKNEIIISKKYDQKYNHTALVREGAPINRDELNELIEKLEKLGTMKSILTKYGIKN
jgi:ABC-type amino acid transport substrate-binding protein